jgi:hypothetical protein
LLARRGEPVRAVIESMNGPRSCTDARGVGLGVLVADAHKIQGACAAGLQDRPDRRAGLGGCFLSTSTRRFPPVTSMPRPRLG